MSNENIDIPYLEFPEVMKVKIVPAEKDAIVSFVTKQEDREAIVSLVILKHNNKPAWLVRPYGNSQGWTSVIGITHTNELFDTIQDIFKYKGSTHQDIKA